MWMVLILSSAAEGQTIYVCENGSVDFISDAPLEMIQASSDKLVGALNIEDRSFSFRIPTKSFEGFNSSLQKTHFNQDYMESDRYPNSTFKGKIIEEIDLTQPGNYSIRAKGTMTIHGVGIDRIIRCNLNTGSNRIEVKSDFTIFLEDQNITIPSIVNKKIAEEIYVGIDLILVPK